MRGLDSRVGVLGCAVRRLGPDLAAAGVDDIELLAGLRVLPLAADEGLGAEDVRVVELVNVSLTSTVLIAGSVLAVANL